MVTHRLQDRSAVTALYQSEVSGDPGAVASARLRSSTNPSGHVEDGS